MVVAKYFPGHACTNLIISTKMKDEGAFVLEYFVRDRRTHEATYNANYLIN